MYKIIREEPGQGMTEYALLLALVAVVAIAILAALGPQIGDIFSQITETMDGGVLLSGTAVRTGGGHGNDVVVTIAVSRSTTVTATDSQSGNSASTLCNDTCQVTLTGVGDAAGHVTITAEGDSLTTGYPLKL